MSPQLQFSRYALNLTVGPEGDMINELRLRSDRILERAGFDKWRHDLRLDLFKRTPKQLWVEYSILPTTTPPEQESRKKHDPIN